jgi:hypothetical protein
MIWEIEYLMNLLEEFHELFMLENYHWVIWKKLNISWISSRRFMSYSCWKIIIEWYEKNWISHESPRGDSWVIHVGKLSLSDMKKLNISWISLRSFMSYSCWKIIIEWYEKIEYLRNLLKEFHELFMLENYHWLIWRNWISHESPWGVSWVIHVRAAMANPNRLEGLIFEKSPFWGPKFGFFLKI